MLGGVHGPGDHPVRVPQCGPSWCRNSSRPPWRRGPSARRCPCACAARSRRGRSAPDPLRSSGIDDGDAVELEAQLPDAAADLVRVAEQGELRHLAQGEDLGGLRMRSSLPSGRTMRWRLALARWISSYSNMSGRDAASEWRTAMRPRRSSTSTCAFEQRRGRRRSCGRPRRGCVDSTRLTARAVVKVSVGTLRMDTLERRKPFQEFLHVHGRAAGRRSAADPATRG